MGCGCNEPREPREQIEPIRGEEDRGPLVLVRGFCRKCTMKHLSYAYVSRVEVDNGYPTHINLAMSALIDLGLNVKMPADDMRAYLDKKARAVGHLVHAMEECPNRNLAMKIRRAYTAILDGEENTDILKLIEGLNETA